jgi:16S rRNA (uracil1498-N3)-methyltransferase
VVPVVDIATTRYHDPLREARMSDPLFLVAALPEGDELVLDGPEGHHAATVQRLRVGESLLVGDGRGTVVRAAVTAVGKGTLSLRLGARSFERAPSPRIVVVQGIAKADRGELAVQAMTEVGVDTIVPWSAARSVAQWKSERSHQRWVDTAREATKQSRRAWVPVVEQPLSTRDMAARFPGALVLHEESTVPLSTVELPVDGAVVLVIGPEGGITPDELGAFEKAGATAVRLGSNVLRTSTPATAIASHARLGRVALIRADRELPGLLNREFDLMLGPVAVAVGHGHEVSEPTGRRPNDMGWYRPVAWASADSYRSIWSMHDHTAPAGPRAGPPW